MSPADERALERARAALQTMGPDARPAGAPQNTPSVYMDNLSDGLGLLHAALAREACIAANDTECLLEIGDLLFEKARPIRSRAAFEKAVRKELWLVLRLAACVVATVCVFLIEPVRTWLFNNVGPLVHVPLGFYTYLLGISWFNRADKAKDYRPYLHEAQRAYGAAGAIAKVVAVGERFLALGYEREARDAFADAVKCAERS